MALIKTEALVLRTDDYSESSRLVTVFSPEHGRMRLLAKGIKRLKSRDRGALEPFSQVQVTVYSKGTDSLATLKEATLLRAPKRVREDYERWLLVSTGLELLDRATLPGEGLGALYLRACALIDDMETTDRPYETTASALLDMLRLLGFGAQMRRCALCGRENSLAGVRIDLCAPVCKRCMGESVRVVHLPPGTVRALRGLSSGDRPAVSALRLSRAQIGQVFRLLGDLIQYHLEITLNSLKMLGINELELEGRAAKTVARQ